MEKQLDFGKIGLPQCDEALRELLVSEQLRKLRKGAPVRIPSKLVAYSGWKNSPTCFTDGETKIIQASFELLVKGSVIRDQLNALNDLERILEKKNVLEACGDFSGVRTVEDTFGRLLSSVNSTSGENRSLFAVFSRIVVLLFLPSFSPSQQALGKRVMSLLEKICKFREYSVIIGMIFDFYLAYIVGLVCEIGKTRNDAWKNSRSIESDLERVLSVWTVGTAMLRACFALVVIGEKSSVGARNGLMFSLVSQTVVVSQLSLFFSSAISTAASGVIGWEGSDPPLQLLSLAHCILHDVLGMLTLVGEYWVDRGVEPVLLSLLRARRSAPLLELNEIAALLPMQALVCVGGIYSDCMVRRRTDVQSWLREIDDFPESDTQVALLSGISSVVSTEMLSSSGYSLSSRLVSFARRIPGSTPLQFYCFEILTKLLSRLSSVPHVDEEWQLFGDLVEVLLSSAHEQNVSTNFPALSKSAFQFLGSRKVSSAQTVSPHSIRLDVLERVSAMPASCPQKYAMLLVILPSFVSCVFESTEEKERFMTCRARMLREVLFPLSGCRHGASLVLLLKSLLAFEDFPGEQERWSGPSGSAGTLALLGSLLGEAMSSDGGSFEPTSTTLHHLGQMLPIVMKEFKGATVAPLLKSVENSPAATLLIISVARREGLFSWESLDPSSLEVVRNGVLSSHEMITRLSLEVLCVSRKESDVVSLPEAEIFVEFLVFRMRTLGSSVRSFAAEHYIPRFLMRLKRNAFISKSAKKKRASEGVTACLPPEVCQSLLRSIQYFLLGSLYPSSCSSRRTVALRVLEFFVDDLFPIRDERGRRVGDEHTPDVDNEATDLESRKQLSIAARVLQPNVGGGKRSEKIHRTPKRVHGDVVPVGSFSGAASPQQVLSEPLYDSSFFPIFLSTLLDAWDPLRAQTSTLLSLLPLSTTLSEDSPDSVGRLVVWGATLLDHALVRECDAGARVLLAVFSRGIVGGCVGVAWDTQKTEKCVQKSVPVSVCTLKGIGLVAGLRTVGSGGVVREQRPIPEFDQGDFLSLSSSERQRRFFSSLISSLAERVQMGLKDGFESVIAAEHSIHGWLMAIRFCVRKLSLCIADGVLWKPIFSELIALFPPILFITEGVISPLREDAGGEGVDDNVEIDEFGSIPSPDQKVKVCCWLALKEVAELMGDVVGAVSLEAGEFLSISDVELMGELLLQLLLRETHRGAVQRASAGLEDLCRHLLGCVSTRLRSLPLTWLTVLLNVTSSSPLDCARYVIPTSLRRSAGIPFAVLAVLRGEPVSGARVAVSESAGDARAPVSRGVAAGAPRLFPTAMNRLVEELSAVEEEPRIHSLNVLRAIILDKRFGPKSESYLPSLLGIALDGLMDSSWPIKNSSTLLFAALVKVYVSPARSAAESHEHAAVLLARAQSIGSGNEEWIRPEVRLPGVTATSFFQSFPSLFSLFLSRIVAVKENRFYPVLVLIARLLPEDGDPFLGSRLMKSGRDAMANTQNSGSTRGPMGGGGIAMDCFVDPILALAQHREGLVREMAARALVPCIPRRSLEGVLRRCLGAIGNDASGLRHNEAHGMLLCCYALCSATVPDVPLSSETMQKWISSNSSLGRVLCRLFFDRVWLCRSPCLYLVELYLRTIERFVLPFLRAGLCPCPADLIAEAESILLVKSNDGLDGTLRVISPHVVGGAVCLARAASLVLKILAVRSDPLESLVSKLGIHPFEEVRQAVAAALCEIPRVTEEGHFGCVILLRSVFREGSESVRRTVFELSERCSRHECMSVLSQLQTIADFDDFLSKQPLSVRGRFLEFVGHAIPIVDNVALVDWWLSLVDEYSHPAKIFHLRRYAGKTLSSVIDSGFIVPEHGRQLRFWRLVLRCLRDDSEEVREDCAGSVNRLLGGVRPEPHANVLFVRLFHYLRGSVHENVVLAILLSELVPALFVTVGDLSNPARVFLFENPNLYEEPLFDSEIALRNLLELKNDLGDKWDAMFSESIALLSSVSGLPLDRLRIFDVMFDQLVSLVDASERHRASALGFSISYHNEFFLTLSRLCFLLKVVPDRILDMEKVWRLFDRFCDEREHPYILRLIASLGDRIAVPGGSPWVEDVSAPTAFLTEIKQLQ